MPDDFLRKRGTSLLLYGFPILAIVVSGALHLEPRLLAPIWTVALVIMGVTCLVNAARCGRVHCLFTGPFFLLIAIVTFLAWVEVLRLSRSSWETLGLVLLAGGIMLFYLPEQLMGRYRRR